MQLVAFVAYVASIAVEGTMPHKEQIQPPIALSKSDQRQVLELYQKIQRSRAKLVGPDGRTQSLPASLYEFLVKLIADLCEGQSVAILLNRSEERRVGKECRCRW